jgi:hypothetical protein
MTSMIASSASLRTLQPCTLFQHVSSERRSSAQRNIGAVTVPINKKGPFLQPALLGADYSLNESRSNIQDSDTRGVVALSNDSACSPSAGTIRFRLTGCLNSVSQKQWRPHD